MTSYLNMKGCKLTYDGISTTIDVTEHIDMYKAYFGLKYLKSKIVISSPSLVRYEIHKSVISWYRLVRFAQEFKPSIREETANKTYILSSSEMVNILYVSPKQLYKDMTGPVYSVINGDTNVKEVFKGNVPSNVFLQLVSQYINNIGDFAKFRYGMDTFEVSNTNTSNSDTHALGSLF